MKQHTVDVWGKPNQVEAYQNSKTVWIAVGFYKGERIEVRDRSETAALRRWMEAARHKGNS